MTAINTATSPVSGTTDLLEVSAHSAQGSISQVREFIARQRAGRSVSSSDIKRCTEDLMTLAQSGDQRVRNALIELNMGLVHRIIVQRYAWLDDTSDLVQEGALALNSAIDAFDVEAGLSFSTYASQWIWARLTQAVRVGHEVVKVPERTSKLVSRLYADYRRNLHVCNGNHREAVQATAQAHELQRDRVERYLMLRNHAESADRDMGETGSTTWVDLQAHPTVRCPSDDLSMERVRDRLKNAISTLPPKHRQVMQICTALIQRGEDPTPSVVAEHLGVSRQRISVVMKESHEMLRAVFKRGANEMTYAQAA